MRAAAGHLGRSDSLQEGSVRSAHGGEVKRKDSLHEDSFIFNDEDEDAGPGFFGVDSDDEYTEAFRASGGASCSNSAYRASKPTVKPNPQAKPRDPAASPASAPKSKARPLSAPCTGARTTTTNNEWWRAPSSNVAAEISKDQWWAKDTLRRLHLEQLERLRDLGGVTGLNSLDFCKEALAPSAAGVAFEASAAAVATADSLLKGQSSL